MNIVQQQYMDDLADKIVSLMQEHGANWKKPWTEHSGYPQNPSTNKVYQGINVINLMLSQYLNSFTSSIWASYNQWRYIGHPVMEGQKSVAKVVFYTRTIDKNSEDEREYAMMRVTPVFNADQVKDYAPKIEPSDKVFNDYDVVEGFIENLDANINHGGSMAGYAPAHDKIVMPNKSAFIDTESATAEQHYYSTLLHELVHWTGHKDRCDRELILSKNKEDYAKEELVAEFGSALLCAMLSVTATPMEDHAHYLNYWIKMIKEDKRDLKNAIKKAQNAVQYLDNLQPTSAIQLAAE